MQKNCLGELAIHSSLVLTLSDSNRLKEIKEVIFKQLLDLSSKQLFEKDACGNTVVHIMAIHGYDQLLHEIKQSEPLSTFVPNNHHQYPIHTAILNLKLNCIEELLSLDKTATLTDAEGNTPLHYAAKYGNEAIVKACLDKTKNVNIPNFEGKTPLMIAQKANNSDAEKMLRAVL